MTLSFAHWRSAKSSLRLEVIITRRAAVRGFFTWRLSAVRVPERLVLHMPTKKEGAWVQISQRGSSGVFSFREYLAV